jgi:hypothetical protein
MTDFQWQQHHLEWFVKIFSGTTKELSSGDIEKRYTPKKGEPKKGKSKNGEKTITVQDFRNLMRAVVTQKLARVTASHVRGKGYRIKMVNEQYPYSQNFFFVERLRDLMPNREMLLEAYIPSSEIEWDRKAEDLLTLCQYEGRRYSFAFQIFNEYGGDFDSLFDYLEESFKVWVESEGLYISLLLGDAERELFTLKINFFVQLYRAFEIGNDELVKDCVDNSIYRFEVNEFLFVDVFFACVRSDLIRNFLWFLEKPETKLRARTYYDHMIELLKEYRAMVEERSVKDKESHQKPINKKMKLLMGDYKPSSEAWYRFEHENGRHWRELLAMSDRPELKNALARVEKAFQELEAFKVGLLRPRKNLGNASVD